MSSRDLLQDCAAFLAMGLFLYAAGLWLIGGFGP